MEGKGLSLTQLLVARYRLPTSFSHGNGSSFTVPFFFYSTMPKIPRSLAATPILTLHQQYLTVISRSTHHILSLDPDTLLLMTYYWYVVILIYPFIGKLLFVQTSWRREACDIGCTVQLSKNPGIPQTLLFMPTIRYGKRDWAPVRGSCHTHTGFWVLRGGVCCWMRKEPMQLSRFVLALIKGKYWY